MSSFGQIDSGKDYRAIKFQGNNVQKLCKIHFAEKQIAVSDDKERRGEVFLKYEDQILQNE